MAVRRSSDWRARDTREPDRSEPAVLTGRAAAASREADFYRSWKMLAQRARDSGITEEDIRREITEMRAGR
jgi:hypothetical protein